MEIKKVLFISQEVAPYVPEGAMSTICRDLPQSMQEKGVEVRSFMPKYGAINERRNQLHEVIRLSGLNIIIDDTDHPLVIKVATLMPSRMQVYFIYNEDYLAHTPVHEFETVTSPDDNDERMIFYIRGVIETVCKLRWNPAIIQCNGWISALAPLLMRKCYNDDPTFSDAKIVIGLFEETLTAPLDIRLADKLVEAGVPQHVLKNIIGKQATELDLMQFALDNCDAIMQCGDNVSPELMAMAVATGKPLLRYESSEQLIAATPDFYQSLLDA
ncbi:MAG: glycogen/starch synthase [Muribaculaceae bacterium]|nr:glycogen/starch synthase [Muribaculaceae bacterium]